MVAGGFSHELNKGKKLNVVEVFDMIKWSRVAPLPHGIRSMTSTLCNGTWYLGGGRRQGGQVYYASMEDLVRSRESQVSSTVWTILSDPKFFIEDFSITMLGGCLVALGGCKPVGDREEPTSVSSIHVYCPCNGSWIPADNLRYNKEVLALRKLCTISLPTGEVMIIGGHSKEEYSNHVYKLSMQ